MEDIPYYGENEAITSAIDFVIQNVPEPVRVFALERCIFTSLDKGCGGCCFTVPLDPGLVVHPAFWLIQISEDFYCKSSFRYRKCSQNSLRYIVAHELAHAYLALTSVKLQDEAAAIQLAEQWGFRAATGKQPYAYYLRLRADAGC